MVVQCNKQRTNSFSTETFLAVIHMLLWDYGELEDDRVALRLNQDLLHNMPLTFFV